MHSIGFFHARSLATTHHVPMLCILQQRWLDSKFAPTRSAKG